MGRSQAAKAKTHERVGRGRFGWQELFARLSLRNLCAVGQPRGASALRYLKCSMNARSLGKT
jgi:hypothetical protein